MVIETLTPIEWGVNIILLFFVVYFPIGYAGNIAAMKLQPKWGMRTIMLRFGTVRVIASLLLFLVVITPGLELLMWFGLVVTTFFGGYGIFHIPFQYLAIDEDEVLYGSRREGMFIGVMALLTKPATSLGPIIATFILTIYGYVQGGGLEAQPASAFFGIKILWLLIPALVAALSLVSVYYYPLHGEELKEMQEKLAKLHVQKREALLKSMEITNEEVVENDDL